MGLSIRQQYAILLPSATSVHILAAWHCWYWQLDIKHGDF